MRIQTLFALSALMAAGACKPAANADAPAAAGAAPKAAVVETLASYPHGAFLENLAVAPDGEVYFTSYFAKALMVLRPGAEAAQFVALPAHPVGVLQTADGFIVRVCRWKWRLRLPPRWRAAREPFPPGG